MLEKKSEAKTVKFTIVGKIMKPKNDFKWYEIKEGKKGKTTLLNFNVKTKSNIFRMNLMGFLDDNEEERKIFAFKKEGEKNVKLSFLYSEKDKYISEMTEFSKMIFKNNNGKEEFCHNTDFIEFLKKLINNGEIIDKPLKIEGKIEYSRYKNKNNEDVEGKKYIPRKITLLDDEYEEKAEANIELLFDENSIVAGETENTMILDGKVIQYDSKLKKDILFEEKVEFDFTGKDSKAIEVIKDRLNLDEKEPNKLNKLGVKVDLIRGSEDIELTEDMLSDDEKINLELGLMTMEELKQEKGMGKGTFREKNIFKGLVRGYSSGAKLTDKTEKDYEIKMEMDINDVFENTEVIDEDDILPF